MFTGERAIAVALVGDILFSSADEQCIGELGSQLRKQGLLLKQEDDAAEHL